MDVSVAQGDPPERVFRDEKREELEGLHEDLVLAPHLERLPLE